VERTAHGRNQLRPASLLADDGTGRYWEPFLQDAPLAFDSPSEVQFVRDLEAFYNSTAAKELLAGKSLYLLRNADTQVIETMRQIVLDMSSNTRKPVLAALP
jgi:hypothetical protein